MNSKVYKWCAVPQCTNTSLKTPHKVFIYVPNDKTMRFKWLTLARRDPKAISLDSSIYFCEDHFDLPNDMDNYMQYQIMGSVSKIRMKPGCIPTKFECQADRRIPASDTTERPHTPIKQRQELIQKAIKDMEDKNIIAKPLELEPTSFGSSGAEPSISTKTPQPPKLAQSPRSKCSLCSKNFSGFVFACVQCNVRVCGACDARGAHARHYVLRAPSDGLEEQLTEVLSKVRAAVLSAGLAQPSHSPEPEDQPEAESEGEEEGDTDDEESEIILKSEIKEELYWSGSEDPLASSEYEEAFVRDSTHSAAESQIVPAPDNVKQEPPGDGSVILDTGCDVTNTEQPSRRQSVTSNDSEDQPLAKRRRSNSTNTDGNALQDVMILKTEGNKKNTDPNSNPGSPTVAGSLTRRKKE